MYDWSGRGPDKSDTKLLIIVTGWGICDMMSIEEFLRKEQPKVKYNIFAGPDFRKKTIPFDEDKCKVWFDPVIETMLCYLRDQGNTRAFLHNNIAHMEENFAVYCIFPLEEMGKIAGYLRGRGFTVNEHLGIFNGGDSPYIEVRWDRKPQ